VSCFDPHPPFRLVYLCFAVIALVPHNGACIDLELSLSGGGALFSNKLLLDLSSPADFVSSGQLAFSAEGRVPSLPGGVFAFAGFAYGIVPQLEGGDGPHILVTGSNHTVAGGVGKMFSVGRGELGVKLGPSYTWERLSPEYISTDVVDHKQRGLGYFTGIHLIAPLNDWVGLILSYSLLGHPSVESSGRFANGVHYTLSKGNRDHMIQLGMNFRITAGDH